MGNIDQIIILILTLVSALLTWKMVFDFYKTKIHKVITHLIAVITASFMLLSTTFLFMNKNYQRGSGDPQMILSFSSVGILIVMLLILYLFFRYIPSRK
ncbi:MAG: hypothetical protein WA916_08660 [Arcobacter sp.]|uniref:hypothetical protein n=1 Tax=Arcobacter sp. TaxID=1872629 RepID=UPI003C7477F6